jgi:hypothetical protein
LTDPSAAFLAVSDLNLPLVARAGAAMGGTVALDTGSALKSGGAIVLDAPTGVTIADGTVSGAGASWSLGSNSIAFVGASGQTPDALNIDPSFVHALQSAGAVRLASQGNIDLYTPVALGATSAGAAPNLNSLTLLATTIQNQNGGSSVFGAQDLSLGSLTPGSATAPASGPGTLTLVANTVNLAAGGTAISGFASTDLQVSGAVTSAGAASSGVDVGGDLSINAGEIAPGVGATTTLIATESLTIGAPTALASGTHLPSPVGGALTLQAASIVDDGAIAAPSGIVTLTATGGDIQIGNSGSITVAGTLLQAVDQSAPSPGGSIALSATGNVSLGSNTMLNVSGEQVAPTRTPNDQIAPAGTLSIVGGGQVTLAGTLTGSVATGGTGGDFSLDAGQLVGGLAPLVSTLMSGGFSDSVSVRARSGDLALPSGTLAASTISLTADAGTVDIAGSLVAASAARHGFIDLSANNITLESGGTLQAIGGEIELNAGDAIALGTIPAPSGLTQIPACASCAITLNPGSSIVTASGSQAGQLVLRAPALQSSNDVAINLPSTGIAGIGANVANAGQVIIEPVIAFATNNDFIASDLPGDVAAASAFLTAASPVIQQRLIASAAQFSNAAPPLVEIGVDLVDLVNENLMLPALDLSPYSTGVVTGTPQVINLAIRAAGSVSVSGGTAGGPGGISDGFINDPNSGLLALSGLPSASISIVAGADLTSANLASTLAGSTGNLNLATSGSPADGTVDGAGPAVIRTGTGDITLAASGNIIFGADSGGDAAVYTGGIAVPNAPPADYGAGTRHQLLMNFGEDGGNVRISAAGDIVSSPVGLTRPSSDGGDYGVTGWLVHQGNAGGLPPQYGVDFGNFDWNVGAFGGGDVTVKAGADITNLSSAVGDSLVAQNGASTLYGAGGDLSLRAGGDIGTPQIYVADGVGAINAGGGLTATEFYNTGTAAAPSNSPVGAAIALGNSSVSVWVRDSLQVDAIYNPTTITGLASGQALSRSNYETYGADSAVNLSSTTGDATLELLDDGNGPLGTLLGANAVSKGGGYVLLPPTLTVQSLQSDIILAGTEVFLAPSGTGQLTLFAGRDITALNTNGTPDSNASFVMSDSIPLTYPTESDLALANANGSAAVAFSGVIHAGDPYPALVTAGRDIDGLNLSVPKPAEVVAGRDLVDLNFKGQNISANDITLIEAGRDLVTNGQIGGLELGGPGSLDVLTGRNLNLGFGSGIVTVGDLLNANLPTSEGANANVMVGYGSQGADLSNFLSQIISKPTNSYNYEQDLINYVEALNGDSGLDYAQAQADFVQFTTPQQSALIDQVFFDELLASGREANSGTGVGFARGYAAIDALFSGSRAPTAANPSPYDGNLTMTSSEIYTDSGGDISILVPGGSIDVGLANPPAAIVTKPASELGIVAEGTGNVNIYALNDVNVNKSRVFTLGGGNILIWSTLGSIDAGNGSKSSLSVPPPTVSVDKNGNVTLNFGGSLAAGSGIRTIQTSPDVPAGNVDLDAPVGTVNAGDAGIGAAGNINIAAAHVIGVDNINFGGTATGVPSDVSNLGASLSGASNAAAGTTNSSTNSAQDAAAAREAAAPIAQAQLSWLDVFVTGLGEDNCKPDDLECLKKQKAAAP